MKAILTTLLACSLLPAQLPIPFHLTNPLRALMGMEPQGCAVCEPMCWESGDFPNPDTPYEWGSYSTKIDPWPGVCTETCQEIVACYVKCSVKLTLLPGYYVSENGFGPPLTGTQEWHSVPGHCGSSSTLWLAIFRAGSPPTFLGWLKSHARCTGCQQP